MKLLQKLFCQWKPRAAAAKPKVIFALQLELSSQSQLFFERNPFNSFSLEVYTLKTS